MHQTSIYGQDVAKSKGERRVRTLEKSVCIALGRVRYYTNSSQDYRSIMYCFRSIRAKSGILALFSLPLAGRPKDGKRFDAGGRLISSASFLTISDNCERNTPKWNSNNKDSVRKKPLRHGCDWGDLVELSFVKHNVWQRRVSKLLNERSYGRQNQTNRHNMFRNLTSGMKS